MLLRCPVYPKSVWAMVDGGAGKVRKPPKGKYHLSFLFRFLANKTDDSNPDKALRKVKKDQTNNKANMSKANI